MVGVLKWSHPLSSYFNYLPLLLLLIYSFLPNLEANSIVALPFQKPPQPLVVWPATVPKQENLERPKTYDEKNFGQWCRNFTVNRHTQCPEASPFHWFVCCGEDGIECCGGIQTWAYVVLGSVLLSVITILTFYLLLHFQVICAGTWPGEDGEKREDSPCTLLSTSSATPPSSPCSYSPGSNISSIKPTRGDSNSCLSSLVVVVEDHSKEEHT